MNPLLGIVIAGIVAWIIIALVFLGIVWLGKKADKIREDWAKRQKVKRGGQY